LAPCRAPVDPATDRPQQHRRLRGLTRSAPFHPLSVPAVQVRAGEEDERAGGEAG